MLLFCVLPLAVHLARRTRRAYRRKRIEAQKAIWFGRWSDAEEIEYLGFRATIERFGK
jgi:hypothetical protein